MKKEILFLLIGIAFYIFFYRLFRTVENEILAGLIFICLCASLFFTFSCIDNIIEIKRERKAKEWREKADKRLKKYYFKKDAVKRLRPFVICAGNRGPLSKSGSLNFAIGKKALYDKRAKGG